MAEDKKTDSPEYKVGYGQPPQHSKFKPGQSGNPKGRAPKEKGPIKLDIEELLDGPRRVTIDGKERFISATEIGLRKTLEKTIKKQNVQAIAYLFEQFEKHGAIQPGEEIFQDGVVTLRSNVPSGNGAPNVRSLRGATVDSRPLIHGGKAYRAKCSELQCQMDDGIQYPDHILEKTET